MIDRDQRPYEEGDSNQKQFGLCCNIFKSIFFHV